MNGKHRASIALTAALLLGAGAAVVVNGAAAAQPVHSTEPSPPAGAIPNPQSVELERSVSDLLAQVSDLEATMAASPAAVLTAMSSPSATADDPAPAGPTGPAAAVPSASTSDRHGTEQGASEPVEGHNENQHGGGTDD